MRSRRWHRYDGDVRDLERVSRRADGCYGVSFHCYAVVVIEAADEVLLVGGKPLEVLLKLGWAFVQAA